MLSVVIPARNEAGQIGPTVTALLREVARVEVHAEVIVVVNATSDGTAEEAAEAGAQVLVTGRAGKGAALRAGIDAAKGTVIVWCDADGPIPEREVIELAVGVMTSGQSRVGRRVTSATAGPLSRRLAGRVVRYACQLGSFTRPRDPFCPLKAFPSALAIQIAEATQSTGYLFDLEFLIRLDQVGWPIREMEVTWSDRRARFTPRTWLRVFGELPRLAAPLATGSAAGRYVHRCRMWDSVVRVQGIKR